MLPNNINRKMPELVPPPLESERESRRTMLPNNNNRKLSNLVPPPL